MELTFGPDTAYFDQYYDRPMDLNITQTLGSRHGDHRVLLC